MKKPLAIIATIVAIVFNVLGFAAPSFAGASGPVVIPPIEIPTPTAEAAYKAVLAHCDNAGNSVEGVVTVNTVANAQSRLGGELATTASGYGPINLEFLANAGFTFANGPLVTITPSPDLGSAPNCAPLDTDKDGVADTHPDTCANTPAGEAVDVNGCSDSQKDSDGDHVVDSADQCPGTTMGVQVDLATGCALPTVKEVTPLAPTADAHSITIPEVTGVIYTNGDGGVLLAGTYGVFQKAGPYHVKEDGTLTVLAKPAEGYTLVGLAHYMWPFTFKLPDNVNNLTVEMCEETGSDSHPFAYIPNAPVASIVHQGHGSHEKSVIPSITYREDGVEKTFPGLNYDADGQALLARHCVVEKGDVVPNPGQSETPAPDQSTPAPSDKPAPVKAPVKTPATPAAPAAPAATTPAHLQAAASQTVETSTSEEATASSNGDHYVQTSVAAPGYSPNWTLVELGMIMAVIAVALGVRTRTRRSEK